MSQPPPGSKSATTEKEHLLAVYKQTKKLPKKLAEQPALPALFLHLWQWFCEIHQSEPLTFTEIEAWSRLTGNAVTAEEVEILRHLDRLFFKTINGRDCKPSNPGKLGTNRDR